MSQNDAKTREIKGHEYKIYPLTPKTSRHMLLNIVKILGPALGAAADEKGEDLMDKDLTKKATWAEAASKIVDKMSNEKLDEMIDKLAKVTHVDDKPLDKIFEAHFLGDISGQLQWLAFAFEAQFADFLEGWGENSILPAMLRKAG